MDTVQNFRIYSCKVFLARFGLIYVFVRDSVQTRYLFDRPLQTLPSKFSLLDWVQGALFLHVFVHLRPIFLTNQSVFVQRLRKTGSITYWISTISLKI